MEQPPTGATSRRRAGAVPGAAIAEPLEPRRHMSVVVALQSENTLVTVDEAAPSKILAWVRVTGLAPHENLLGIDFRPADGRLYAIGSSNALYTLDPAGGRATAVGAGRFAVPLNGTEFGVDFDPFTDELRVVSDAEQNLRLAPGSGLAVDADLAAAGVQADPGLAFDAADVNAGRNPAVIAIAYTAGNPPPNATGATLYGIDATQDVLVRQGPAGDGPVAADSGPLFTVGTLGIDVAGVGGLDNVTDSTADRALAALSTNLRRASQLYSIDLGTGSAMPLGNIGRGRRPTRDIAVAPAGTDFFVATRRNELLALNTAVPQLVLSLARMTGFASRGERVVGMDVRPATGELWALTDEDRLYTVEAATGRATPVGDASAVNLATETGVAFDFDPAADRIRVTTGAGQNVRFDPLTGTVVDADPADPDVDPDAGLAYAPGDVNAGATPRVVGVAYANNVPASPYTLLFGIDSNLDVLVTSAAAGGAAASPDAGQLSTIGSTIIDVPDQVGFDIVTRGGADAGLAVFAPAGSRRVGVYSVDLTAGVMLFSSGLNRRVRNVAAMALKVEA